VHTAANQPAQADTARGLPMFSGTPSEALEKEKALLAYVCHKSLWERTKVYLHLTGPGWMQSAMTLGASSASASLFAGALTGCRLLWVQPLAMLAGVVMLSALVHQTLSTGCRPFAAIRDYLHPGFAWIWALTSLLVTIIWHIPQYALAAGMTEDMIKAATGWQPNPRQQTLTLLLIGLCMMVFSVYITWSYGHRKRGVRIYEKVLKGFLWLIIAAFALVVINSFAEGKLSMAELLKGCIPNLPRYDDPVMQQKTTSLVIGAFSGAVGLNMTFLFPYTLLARRWGREHRELGFFDLITGMLIPYSIATSLMMAAAGSTLYNTPAIEALIAENRPLTPVLAASMLEQAGLNHYIARFVFGMGILGMVMSTISMQMLTAGFAVCEMFAIEPGGRLYRLACLIPTPAFLGVLFWQKMSYWVAIPTAAICGIMLPIAYIAFFLLNNSRAYLKDDKPVGTKAFVWNAGMLTAIGLSLAAGIYYVADVVWPYMMKLIGSLKG